MYVGVNLADCFPTDPAENAAHDMADDGGEALKALVRANTPVETGELRASWYKEPVRSRRTPLGVEYRSRVATEVEYAIYVEHGTGLWGPEHKKYLILPKQPGGTLSWVDRLTGQRRFAKSVLHPGSPGQYMMASGLAKLEVEFSTALAPRLEAWSREQEWGFAAGQLKGTHL